MRKIGFTSTVPVEVIIASGNIPIDLNNVFINSSNPQRYIDIAEKNGFPRNQCSWVKGIYGLLLDGFEIDLLINIPQGDCATALSMTEIAEFTKGSPFEIFSFSYPYSKDPELLKFEINRFIKMLGTNIETVEKTREALISIRETVKEIDRLTWKENIVTGQENHYFQICCTDFNGNWEKFQNELNLFIKSLKGRNKLKGKRIGYCGVPPIMSDLYSFMENNGSRIVFNEVQRQFSMQNKVNNLYEQYLLYTYPYDIKTRITDILEQVKIRGIEAIIHYTQTFCHHQIEGMVFNKVLTVPVITIEQDMPGPLEARNRMRLEAFLEMI